LRGILVLSFNPCIRWYEVGCVLFKVGSPNAAQASYLDGLDRDAFKELWLLFENADGRFPLYQGESTWIEYIYTVPRSGDRGGNARSGYLRDG